MHQYPSLDGTRINQSDMKFVPKAWGYEMWITNEPLYCGKILFIKAGQSCSLHYHKIKDEVLFVQSGIIHFHKGMVVEDGVPFHDATDFLVIRAGDAYHVPPGLIHQMVAMEDTTIIEISTQHFDSDSHRIRPGSTMP